VVATYNVHYGIGADRRVAPERIADVLLSLDADVIGIQEVGWHYRGRAGLDQFRLLHELTGYTVHAGYTRRHRHAHFGNAILTRLNTVQIRKIELTVRFRAPRCAQIAVVETPRGPLRVVNVHFGLDLWERREQVARLMAALDEEETLPAVLLGDFNGGWRTPRYLQPIAERFPAAAMPKSYPARFPLLPYDRVYVSPSLRLLHAQAIHAGKARRASDHLPVIATLAWPD
jgi:endonuclease/exonuclease/phosphatase family metal-dependent hydrolase